jgi:hypothetical protein
MSNPACILLERRIAGLEASLREAFKERREKEKAAKKFLTGDPARAAVAAAARAGFLSRELGEAKRELAALSTRPREEFYPLLFWTR